MEIDPEIKPLIFLTLIILFIVAILAIFSNIFQGVESIDSIHNKTVIAYEGDICSSPILYIPCNKDLYCTTRGGKIMTKNTPSNQRKSARCMTFKDMKYLQEKYKNAPKDQIPE